MFVLEDGNHGGGSEDPLQDLFLLCAVAAGLKQPQRVVQDYLVKLLNGGIGPLFGLTVERFDLFDDIDPQRVHITVQFVAVSGSAKWDVQQAIVNRIEQACVRCCLPDPKGPGGTVAAMGFVLALLDREHGLLNSLNLTSLWSVALLAVGLRHWTGQGWVASSVAALLPFVLVYAAWALKIVAGA